MTVLVIIGLMSSAVILTLPKEESPLLSYAQDLSSELNAASETALLTNKSFGFGVTRDGYKVARFERGEWAYLTDRDWPEGFRVMFEKDGRRLDMPKTWLPLVVFDPTGQSSEFNLQLSSYDAEYQIYSHGDGRVSMDAKP